MSIIIGLKRKRRTYAVSKIVFISNIYTKDKCVHSECKNKYIYVQIIQGHGQRIEANDGEICARENKILLLEALFQFFLINLKIFLKNYITFFNLPLAACILLP